MAVTDASFVVKDKEASDVGRFLNRILGLSVERQNLVSVILLAVAFSNCQTLASSQSVIAPLFNINFTCAGCNACYIDETVQHFSTRVKEPLVSDRTSRNFQDLQNSEHCRVQQGLVVQSPIKLTQG